MRSNSISKPRYHFFGHLIGSSSINLNDQFMLITKRIKPDVCTIL